MDCETTASCGENGGERGERDAAGRRKIPLVVGDQFLKARARTAPPRRAMRAGGGGRNGIRRTAIRKAERRVRVPLTPVLSWSGKENEGVVPGSCGVGLARSPPRFDQTSGGERRPEGPVRDPRGCRRGGSLRPLVRARVCSPPHASREPQRNLKATTTQLVRRTWSVLR